MSQIIGETILARFLKTGITEDAAAEADAQVRSTVESIISDIKKRKFSRYCHSTWRTLKRRTWNRSCWNESVGKYRLRYEQEQSSS